MSIKQPTKQSRILRAKKRTSTAVEVERCSTAAMRQEILNDPNVLELIKRFSLIEFPVGYMERLREKERYDSMTVYERLVDIGVVDCEYPDFCKMVNAEPGYCIVEKSIVRMGQPEDFQVHVSPRFKKTIKR